MTTPWINQVKHIQDGETVSGGVASRPDRSLESRTDYLKARLDSDQSGQAVFARSVTLDSSLLPGQPVYWDADAQEFAPALAGVELASDSGLLAPTAASDCLGVVFSKESAAVGDVLLFGYAPLDITNATGETPTAGRYYLSSSDAGKLVRQKPAATVSVLFCDGSGRVFVQPAMKNFIEDHVHFRFDLVCRPAGHTIHPELGDSHAITEADPSQTGWLPASDPSFLDRAPDRAMFGYNLAAHPELQRVWPPIPLGAVQVTWDKGNSHTGGVDVPLGADGLIVIDRYGIWWMSDCYGDVPWPLETNTSLSSLPSEASLPISQGAECPRFEKMRLVLSFVRMTFATNKSVVTSLKSADGSPIRLTNCDGVEAETGDLFASLDTDFQISDNDADGNLALKTLDGSKFTRGYMVQGVRSGNANLTVTGSRTKVIGELPYAQGLLAFTVNLEPGDRDLAVQLVRLDDVKERFYKDILYLGFPADQESSIRIKIKIPSAGLPATPKVKLRTQLLGRATGTLPAIGITYRVLPRPGSVEQALPTSDTALTFASSQAITLDSYVEVESQEIDVVAGDTVLYTVTRLDDGYSGEVGLLDVVGVLYSGG